MSVEISYKSGGRFGNNLFQYICARLFAEENGFALLTGFPDQEIARPIPHRDGTKWNTPTITMTDETDLFARSWDPARYVFDGYFQRSKWYHERRSAVLRFLELTPIEEINRKDIVLNLRVGDDYKTLQWIIDPSWYLGILKKENFDRLHIVADVKDEAYLSYFKEYDPIVITSGGKEDWDYLRSFDRIICSNSTFCWWAAYFSQASRIYHFRRWVNHPAPQLHEFPNGISVDGMFSHEKGD